jgi:hypothetical protein
MDLHDHRVRMARVNFRRLLSSLQNTSVYPTAAVKILVRFAFENGTEPVAPTSHIKVKRCSSAFRGRACLSWVRLRIGSPDLFSNPIPGSYKKRAPPYEIRDWKEALVALAAHEFNHVSDFSARRIQSEVRCEFELVRVLEAFRLARADVDREIEAAIEKERLDADTRDERAAAKKKAATARETKLTTLDRKIALWTRKHKLAETKLKKYRRQHARLTSRINSGTEAPVLPLATAAKSK